MKIWKFPLMMVDDQSIAVPSGARPLYVGLDPVGDPCVWALVDPAAPTHGRRVRIVGTGHPIDGEFTGTAIQPYVGTFVQGPFVWHVFMEA